MNNNPKKTRRWGKQTGKMEEDKKNSNIGRNSKKKREEIEGGMKAEKNNVRTKEEGIKRRKGKGKMRKGRKNK
jgi:hypothetical protein